MNVRQAIPPAMRAVLRPVAYMALDAMDYVSGKSDPLVPPRRKSFIGSGDYREVGNEFLRLFTELGGLKPDETVLDVGCGIGRMAVPLTRYLTAQGRYEGFDIVPSGIEWCQSRFTPRYPNFHFQLADVYNEMYNPRGQSKSSEYRFPYPDAAFDFVFLTSVFTHMFPVDVFNYLSEIARVTKPGGRCFITYFLWNETAETNMKAGKTDRAFKFDRDTHRIVDEKQPEFAVALPENWVRKFYSDLGLAIQEPIRYGNWSGRPDFVSYQDIILANKPSS